MAEKLESEEKYDPFAWKWIVYAMLPFISFYFYRSFRILCGFLIKLYHSSLACVNPKYRRRLALLHWIECRTDLKLNGFADLWQNPDGIIALIDSVIPRVDSYGDETQSSRHATLQKTQQLASRYFDIRPMFLGEELKRPWDRKIEKKFIRLLHVIKASIESLESATKQEDAGEYVARGMGLITAIRGEPSSFFIYSRHELDFESMRIEIEGPNNDCGARIISGSCANEKMQTGDIKITFEIIDNAGSVQDGVKKCLKVTYKPNLVGEYKLNIVKQGYIILGSPFNITVDNSRRRSSSSDSRSRGETKIINRVVDFVNEKMLLTDKGELIKIANDPERNTSVALTKLRTRMTEQSAVAISLARILQKDAKPTPEVFFEICEYIMKTCHFILQNSSCSRGLRLVSGANKFISRTGSTGSEVLDDGIITAVAHTEQEMQKLLEGRCNRETAKETIVDNDVAFLKQLMSEEASVLHERSERRRKLNSLSPKKYKAAGLADSLEDDVFLQNLSPSRLRVPERDRASIIMNRSQLNTPDIVYVNLLEAEEHVTCRKIDGLGSSAPGSLDGLFSSEHTVSKAREFFRQNRGLRNSQKIALDLETDFFKTVEESLSGNHSTNATQRTDVGLVLPETSIQIEEKHFNDLKLESTNEIRTDLEAVAAQTGLNVSEQSNFFLDEREDNFKNQILERKNETKETKETEDNEKIGTKHVKTSKLTLKKQERVLLDQHPGKPLKSFGKQEAFEKIDPNSIENLRANNNKSREIANSEIAKKNNSVRKIICDFENMLRTQNDQVDSIIGTILDQPAEQSIEASKNIDFTEIIESKQQQDVQFCEENVSQKSVDIICKISHQNDSLKNNANTGTCDANFIEPCEISPADNCEQKKSSKRKLEKQEIIIPEESLEVSRDTQPEKECGVSLDTKYIDDETFQKLDEANYLKNARTRVNYNISGAKTSGNSRSSDPVPVNFQAQLLETVVAPFNNFQTSDEKREEGTVQEEILAIGRTLVEALMRNPIQTVAVQNAIKRISFQKSLSVESIQMLMGSLDESAGELSPDAQRAVCEIKEQMSNSSSEENSKLTKNVADHQTDSIIDGAMGDKITQKNLENITKDHPNIELSHVKIEKLSEENTGNSNDESRILMNDSLEEEHSPLSRCLNYKPAAENERTNEDSNLIKEEIEDIGDSVVSQSFFDTCQLQHEEPKIDSTIHSTNIITDTIKELTVECAVPASSEKSQLVESSSENIEQNVDFPVETGGKSVKLVHVAENINSTLTVEDSVIQNTGTPPSTVSAIEQLSCSVSQSDTDQREEILSKPNVCIFANERCPSQSDSAAEQTLVSKYCELNAPIILHTIDMTSVNTTDESVTSLRNENLKNEAADPYNIRLDTKGTTVEIISVPGDGELNEESEVLKPVSAITDQKLKKEQSSISEKLLDISCNIGSSENKESIQPTEDLSSNKSDTSFIFSNDTVADMHANESKSEPTLAERISNESEIARIERADESFEAFTKSDPNIQNAISADHGLSVLDVFDDANLDLTNSRALDTSGSSEFQKIGGKTVSTEGLVILKIPNDEEEVLGKVFNNDNLENSVDRSSVTEQQAAFNDEVPKTHDLRGEMPSLDENIPKFIDENLGDVQPKNHEAKEHKNLDLSIDVNSKKLNEFRILEYGELAFEHTDMKNTREENIVFSENKSNDTTIFKEFCQISAASQPLITSDFFHKLEESEPISTNSLTELKVHPAPCMPNEFFGESNKVVNIDKFNDESTSSIDSVRAHAHQFSEAPLKEASAETEKNLVHEEWPSNFVRENIAAFEKTVSSDLRSEREISPDSLILLEKGCKQKAIKDIIETFEKKSLIQEEISIPDGKRDGNRLLEQDKIRFFTVRHPLQGAQKNAELIPTNEHCSSMTRSNEVIPVSAMKNTSEDEIQRFRLSSSGSVADLNTENSLVISCKLCSTSRGIDSDPLDDTKDERSRVNKIKCKLCSNQNRPNPQSIRAHTNEEGKTIDELLAAPQVADTLGSTIKITSERKADGCFVIMGGRSICQEDSSHKDGISKDSKIEAVTLDESLSENTLETESLPYFEKKEEASLKIEEANASQQCTKESVFEVVRDESEVYAIENSNRECHLDNEPPQLRFTVNSDLKKGDNEDNAEGAEDVSELKFDCATKNIEADIAQPMTEESGPIPLKRKNINFDLASPTALGSSDKLSDEKQATQQIEINFDKLYDEIKMNHGLVEIVPPLKNIEGVLMDECVNRENLAGVLADPNEESPGKIELQEHFTKNHGLLINSEQVLNRVPDVIGTDYPSKKECSPASECNIDLSLYEQDSIDIDTDLSDKKDGLKVEDFHNKHDGIATSNRNIDFSLYEQDSTETNLQSVEYAINGPEKCILSTQTSLVLADKKTDASMSEIVLCLYEQDSTEETCSIVSRSTEESLSKIDASNPNTNPAENKSVLRDHNVLFTLYEQDSIDIDTTSTENIPARNKVDLDVEADIIQNNETTDKNVNNLDSSFHEKDSIGMNPISTKLGKSGSYTCEFSKKTNQVPAEKVADATTSDVVLTLNEQDPPKMIKPESSKRAGGTLDTNGYHDNVYVTLYEQDSTDSDPRSTAGAKEPDVDDSISLIEGGEVNQIGGNTVTTLIDSQPISHKEESRSTVKSPDTAGDANLTGEKLDSIERELHLVKNELIVIEDKITLIENEQDSVKQDECAANEDFCDHDSNFGTNNIDSALIETDLKIGSADFITHKNKQLNVHLSFPGLEQPESWYSEAGGETLAEFNSNSLLNNSWMNIKADDFLNWSPSDTGASSNVSPAPMKVNRELDFESIISAPNLEAALKKLEQKINSANQSETDSDTQNDGFEVLTQETNHPPCVNPDIFPEEINSDFTTSSVTCMEPLFDWKTISAMGPAEREIWGFTNVAPSPDLAERRGLVIPPHSPRISRPGTPSMDTIQEVQEEFEEPLINKRVNIGAFHKYSQDELPIITLTPEQSMDENGGESTQQHLTDENLLSPLEDMRFREDLKILSVLDLMNLRVDAPVPVCFAENYGDCQITRQTVNIESPMYHYCGSDTNALEPKVEEMLISAALLQTINSPDLDHDEPKKDLEKWTENPEFQPSTIPSEYGKESHENEIHENVAYSSHSNLNLIEVPLTLNNTPDKVASARVSDEHQNQYTEENERKGFEEETSSANQAELPIKAQSLHKNETLCSEKGSIKRLGHSPTPFNTQKKFESIREPKISLMQEIQQVAGRGVGVRISQLNERGANKNEQENANSSQRLLQRSPKSSDTHSCTLLRNDITHLTSKNNFMKDEKDKINEHIAAQDRGTNVSGSNLVTFWKNYWDKVVEDNQLKNNNSDFSNEQRDNVKRLRYTFSPSPDQTEVILSDTEVNYDNRKRKLQDELTGDDIKRERISDRIQLFENIVAAMELEKSKTFSRMEEKHPRRSPHSPSISDKDEEHKIIDEDKDTILEDFEYRRNKCFQNKFVKLKEYFELLEQHPRQKERGSSPRDEPTRQEIENENSCSSCQLQNKFDIDINKRKRRKRKSSSRRKLERGIIQSAPTSDSETPPAQHSGHQLWGSERLGRRVAERIHIKDLFEDVFNEKDRTGLFRGGVPNRRAVLASLRSIELNLDENGLDNLDHAKSSQKDLEFIDMLNMSNVPRGYQNVYPWIPTTPINQYRSRPCAEHNLIPRNALLQFLDDD